MAGELEMERRWQKVVVLEVAGQLDMERRVKVMRLEEVQVLCLFQPRHLQPLLHLRNCPATSSTPPSVTSSPSPTAPLPPAPSPSATCSPSPPAPPPPAPPFAPPSTSGHELLIVRFHPTAKLTEEGTLKIAKPLRCVSECIAIPTFQNLPG